MSSNFHTVRKRGIWAHRALAQVGSKIRQTSLSFSFQKRLRWKHYDYFGTLLHHLLAKVIRANSFLPPPPPPGNDPIFGQGGPPEQALSLHLEQFYNQCNKGFMASGMTMTKILLEISIFAVHNSTSCEPGGQIQVNLNYQSRIVIMSIFTQFWVLLLWALSFSGGSFVTEFLSKKI